MQTISLDTAVSEIYQACQKSSEKSPFFFIVGAGISSPIIPLAVEIERECKEIAIKHKRDKGPSSNSPNVTYSHWFQQAFPQPKERQEFLVNKIKNKPISLANLRLAHLLSEKNISNLVITPNFDDMLSRALWLFQIHHIVCDHPATIARINPDAKDIQILHVHGSYLFYDCCNTNHEIKRRTKGNDNPVKTFMDTLLISRVPLVIGYGGWEDDVIMKALKRRLINNSTLPYNIYWFCFTEREIDKLPPWLKNHGNVKFVVPPSMPKKNIFTSEKNLNPIFLDDSEKENQLNAVRILEELLVTFGYNTPPLINDPLTFFSRHIKKSWPKTYLHKRKWSFDTEEDLYFIDSVIEKIDRANMLLKQNMRLETQQNQKKMEQILNLIRNSRYLEALIKANLIDEKKLDSKGKIQLTKVLMTASINVRENPDAALQGYEKIIQIINKLDKKTKMKTAVNQDLVYAYLFKGNELEKQNKNRAAIKSYDEIIKKYSDHLNATIRSCVADALWYKAGILRELNQSGSAIRIYCKIDEMFEYDKDIQTKGTVASALIDLSEIYVELNEDELALELYNTVIKRYRNSKPDSVISDILITAYYKKGNLFMRKKRYGEAAEVYSKALERIEQKTNISEFLDRVFKIAISKGMALSDNDQNTKAIETIDLLLEKYKTISSPEIRCYFIDAMLIRGTILMKMNNQNEAIKAFNGIIRRFSRSKDPEIRENLNIARQKLDCLKNCPYR